MTKIKRKILNYDIYMFHADIDQDFDDVCLQEDAVTKHFRKPTNVCLSDEILIENC